MRSSGILGSLETQKSADFIKTLTEVRNHANK